MVVKQTPVSVDRGLVLKAGVKPMGEATVEEDSDKKGTQVCSLMFDIHTTSWTNFNARLPFSCGISWRASG